MATPSGTRCKRCGTMLRKGRTVCPCCGLDSTAPEEDAAAAPAENAEAGKSEKGKRKVAAKRGAKMCQVCMVTVAEEQLIEQDGQKVCPTCAEGMRNKAAKKTTPPEKK